jgi:hypothetical protein
MLAPVECSCEPLRRSHGWARQTCLVFSLVSCHLNYNAETSSLQTEICFTTLSALHVPGLSDRAGAPGADMPPGADLFPESSEVSGRRDSQRSARPDITCMTGAVAAVAQWRHPRSLMRTQIYSNAAHSSRAMCSARDASFLHVRLSASSTPHRPSHPSSLQSSLLKRRRQVSRQRFFRTSCSAFGASTMTAFAEAVVYSMRGRTATTRTDRQQCTLD